MRHMSRDERIEEFNKILDSKIIGPALHATYRNQFVEWLNENGYFDVPASIRHHGTQSGDLFRHSLKVAEILADYTDKLGLEWRRWCSPWVVGLFHDLCKMDDYIRDGSSWKRDPTPLIKGHGDKSVMMLSQFIPLTEEEMLCIRYHMGAYEVDDWEQFDLAIHKYPNVLYTHTADMAASKIFDI